MLRNGQALGANMQERIRPARGSGQLTGEARGEEADGRRFGQCQAERAAWEVANPGPYDEEKFRREVMPRLAEASIYAIWKATGLSTAQTWRIKAGKVPHPMRWQMVSGVVAAAIDE